MPAVTNGTISSEYEIQSISNTRLRKTLKIYKENSPRNGGGMKKENGEVKLYNKYAYDYFDTRDCEGGGREEKTTARKRGEV